MRVHKIKYKIPISSLSLVLKSASTWWLKRSRGNDVFELSHGHITWKKRTFIEEGCNNKIHIGERVL